jgi:hypothetical protein
MCCSECGFEFDEINESQPVCPACGALPVGEGDDPEILAPAQEVVGEEEDSEIVDFDQDSDRMPVDLQEAADDAETLLEATGFATFDLTEGRRNFRLLTEKLM